MGVARGFQTLRQSVAKAREEVEALTAAQDDLRQRAAEPIDLIKGFGDFGNAGGIQAPTIPFTPQNEGDAGAGSFQREDPLDRDTPGGGGTTGSRSTRLAFKLPTNPADVQLSSLTGGKVTTLEFVQKHCKRVTMEVPHPLGPLTPLGEARVRRIDVWDCTLALGDPEAIFPTEQLRGPSTLSTGGGGGDAAAGGGSSGSGFSAGGGGGAAPGTRTTSATPGAGKSGEVTVRVDPPRIPTPGERLIADRLEQQTTVLREMVREQKRSGGGVDLRRLRL